jgi:hypothetical protein
MIVTTPQVGSEPPAQSPVTMTATVVSTGTSTTNGQVIVNVEVDQSEAAMLAATAATGRIALVLNPAVR